MRQVWVSGFVSWRHRGTNGKSRGRGLSPSGAPAARLTASSLNRLLSSPLSPAVCPLPLPGSRVHCSIRADHWNPLRQPKSPASLVKAWLSSRRGLKSRMASCLLWEKKSSEKKCWKSRLIIVTSEFPPSDWCHSSTRGRLLTLHVIDNRHQICYSISTFNLKL